CGAGQEIVIKINAKDDCGETAPVTATFTVPAYADDLMISDVQDLTVNACDFEDQAALNMAFEDWLSGFGVTGGCNPDSTDLSDLVAPSLCGDGDGTPSNALWINEFHYDNDGGDTGEFVEIAGTAGIDLTGYSVVLYNGSNGTVYSTISLSGSIDDEGSGYGALSFSQGGIQNGAPDGLALVEGSNVLEFISYEGSFTAVGGPADGMDSVDIGISEASSTPIGESLQRIGSGSQASDFSWIGPVAESPGSLNSGQSATGGSTSNAVTVTFEVSDLCDSGSDTATFTVNPSPELVISDVQDLTVNACDYEDQAALEIAFETWLSGFGVTGGCDPDVTDLSGLMAPSLCVQAEPNDYLWINELHYDNVGGDVGEFIEIAGKAGVNLANYTIVFYNGANGTPYNTEVLSGTIDDEASSGFGAVVFDNLGASLQNGSPDGLALINSANEVVQFISYEGTFIAVGGPADGLESVDIGVAEPGEIGQSLQLTGTGSLANQFSWVGPFTQSPGLLNTGQTINSLPSNMVE
ncbi:MAG: hypothetical protein ACWA5P_11135, partial [bacterium]